MAFVVSHDKTTQYWIAILCNRSTVHPAHKLSLLRDKS
jgi:hypothetical protein